MESEIIDKIKKHNTFVIFYVPDCPYCQAALNLLREKNVPYKGYNIYSINGGFPVLLDILNRNANQINYNHNHKTKPIIFYNGNFLGGYDSLNKFLY